MKTYRNVQNPILTYTFELLTPKTNRLIFTGHRQHNAWIFSSQCIVTLTFDPEINTLHPGLMESLFLKFQ